METNLSITLIKEGDHTVLKLQGRLDGNNAGYLDDKLNELIQEGHYHVDLDTENISFLSSAGIRILVKQAKAFRNVSGKLDITKFSEGVKTVLDMVGMGSMFTGEIKPVVEESSNKEQPDNVKFGFRFIKKNIGNTQSKVKITGNPDKIQDCSYTGEDSHFIRLDEPYFGLGIGAFGNGFEDCKSHYGEFISLGDSIAFLPSDSSKTPDYMTKTGNLIPEINVLYSIGTDGNFGSTTSFRHESETSISLSQIVEALAETCGYKSFSMLMIAESCGLVGASIKTSPASLEKPFVFPDIRNKIKLTTEPAYVKSIGITFGIVSTNPDEKLKPFLRPVSMGSNIYIHAHTAVFSYTPLQKENSDFGKTISYLFEDCEILDVLHLLNDNREINGIGESMFKSGICWTSEIINKQ
jgi:anti-anti-sigma factor